MNYDVIIIGGGASGMMAGVVAAREARGQKILIIEKNSSLGEKLKITGGGRCNIFNAEYDTKVLLKNYGEGEKYLHSLFSKFDVSDTEKFFKDIGIEIKIEDRKRAFPKSERAVDVFEALNKEIIKNSVEIKYESKVEQILFSEGIVSGIKIFNDKNIYTAKKYILSTGGYSHPETGSTGDGFKFLENNNIKINKPTPSLVPVIVTDNWVKGLTGKSIENIKLTFFVDGIKKKLIKVDKETKNRILFTHFGLSGPTILNNSKLISDWIKEGSVVLSLDLFPNLDEGDLDKNLLSIFDQNKNKILKNVLKEIYPGNILEEIFLDKDNILNSISLDREINDIKKEERKLIIKTLKSLTINISGLMGYDKAIIADGGVDLSEIDFTNMSLKKIQNLYVTGDILDIVRPSGGYSLQLCWTTGFVAGKNN